MICVSMTTNKITEIGAKAHEYEKKNGCSQAVLAALQEGLSIGDLQSFKAATALAGGAARRGETCGAVLGALMSLGLYEGREHFEDVAKLNNTVADGITFCNEFMRNIEKEYGLNKPLNTTLCRDLLLAIYGRTWDLTDSAERTDFFTNGGGHGDRGCPMVCKIASETAAALILKKSSTP
jgi:C_GCAxxG_C_C family probable redox protein